MCAARPGAGRSGAPGFRGRGGSFAPAWGSPSAGLRLFVVTLPGLAAALRMARLAPVLPALFVLATVVRFAPCRISFGSPVLPARPLAGIARVVALALAALLAVRPEPFLSAAPLRLTFFGFCLLAGVLAMGLALPDRSYRFE